MRTIEIVKVQSFPAIVPANSPYVSYQIHFKLSAPLTLKIGKLGTHYLPAGNYVYTGSAKRNIRARVLRHLTGARKKHWHIDYLLADPGISFTRIVLSEISECKLNTGTDGRIIVPRFGSTDCGEGCGSHLKLVDENRSTKRQSQTKDNPFRKALRKP